MNKIQNSKKGMEFNIIIGLIMLVIILLLVTPWLVDKFKEGGKDIQDKQFATQDADDDDVPNLVDKCPSIGAEFTLQTGLGEDDKTGCPSDPADFIDSRNTKELCKADKGAYYVYDKDTIVYADENNIDEICSVDKREILQEAFGAGAGGVRIVELARIKDITGESSPNDISEEKEEVDSQFTQLTSEETRGILIQKSRGCLSIEDDTNARDAWC